MKLNLLLLLGFVLAEAARAATPVTPNLYARVDYAEIFSYSALVADTNGDGIPDLITASGGVQVEFGNGDGTFRSGPLSEVFGSFPGVNAGLQAVADLNHDGKVDLVFAGYYGFSYGGQNYAQIFVALGNGDGTFQEGTFYAAGTDAYNTAGDLVVADFNKDGNLDVAEVANSGVWLFLGKGDGTFKPAALAAPLAVGGLGIALADFNLDGNPDLVVGIPNILNRRPGGDGFYVVLGKADGTFQTPQHFTQPNRPYGVAAGKLGPNGFPGIALLVTAGGSEPAYTAVYMGDGKGGFTGPQILNLPGNAPYALAIGDLNDDGIGDVISGGSEAYVAYGTAGGGFTKPVAYPVQSGDILEEVVLADLRNNGLLDIVTDSSSAVSVLLNEKKGRFEDGVFTKLPSSTGCGVSGDFNGDGKPDLAVNTAAGITILLGTGKAFDPFTVGQSMTLAGAGCLTSTGDLNGDGILDLVITGPSGVVSYLGNGDGTFTLKSTTPTPSFVGYLVLADFNHDGKLDFATCGNLLAYGNGDGTFQTPEPFITDPTPYGYNNIAVGDINNDGWPDLVVTNYDFPIMPPLYVGLNNHSGGFTSVLQTIALTNTAVLADLNGDGYLDLLCTDGVYLGDGKGDFTLKEGLDLALLDGTFGMVADLNGDAIPDIVILGGGTIEVNLGYGDGTYAAALLPGSRSRAGLPAAHEPSWPEPGRGSGRHRCTRSNRRRHGAAQFHQITMRCLINGQIVSEEVIRQEKDRLARDPCAALAVGGC